MQFVQPEILISLPLPCLGFDRDDIIMLWTVNQLFNRVVLSKNAPSFLCDFLISSSEAVG